MYCNYLSLTNFRNYARLDLELPPRVTVVLGGNAQGKSNLLEAIYFLATTKSFRAGSDRELVNWLANTEGTAFARLIARVRRGHIVLNIEILIKEEVPREEPGLGPALISPLRTTVKRIKVNNVTKRAIDIIGEVNVVMFSPQDIDLIQGAPHMRRRYLDVTISQVDPRYVRTLAHYSKVLLQRNYLLRQIRERHGRPEQLLFWDQELVNAGSYLIWQRLAAVASLNSLAHTIHRQLADGESLSIQYRSSLEWSGDEIQSRGMVDSNSDSDLGEDLGRLREAFKQQLDSLQTKEIAYGLSLLGPHRDDLVFLVNERDMNIYGSRGQQRTIALSLKLAETRFMRSMTDEEPILLLDDVMSELDEARRNHVLAIIGPEQQVIITTTDLHHFTPEFLDQAALFRVEQGIVERIAL